MAQLAEEREAEKRMSYVVAVLQSRSRFLKPQRETRVRIRVGAQGAGDIKDMDWPAAVGVEHKKTRTSRTSPTAAMTGDWVVNCRRTNPCMAG
jgi:hypothetical protein